MAFGYILNETLEASSLIWKCIDCCNLWRMTVRRRSLGVMSEYILIGVATSSFPLRDPVLVETWHATKHRLDWCILNLSLPFLSLTGHARKYCNQTRIKYYIRKNFSKQASIRTFSEPHMDDQRDWKRADLGVHGISHWRRKTHRTSQSNK